MVIPLGGLYRRLLLTWLEIRSLVPRVLASVVAVVRWAKPASRKYRRSVASPVLPAAVFAYSSATSFPSTPLLAGVCLRLTEQPR